MKLRHPFIYWILIPIIFISCGRSAQNVDQPRFNNGPKPPQVNCTDDSPCPTTGDCSNTPFEGPRAIPITGLISQSNSGYFGKRIAVGHVQAIMSLSGEATWNYILGLGIPIYKISSNNGPNGCRYFAPLAQAPPSLQKKWRSFQGGNMSRGLLGLFTSKTLKISNGEVGLLEPSILLREDSQRWTLIHEFHHFLFAEGRLNQRPYLFEQDLMNAMETARAKISKIRTRLDTAPTRKLVGRILKNYSVLFEHSYELDRRGPLEEFSIESSLLEQWSFGNLGFINPEADLNNAIAYMSTNQQQVKGNYRKLRKRLRGVRNLAKNNNWNDLVKKAGQQLKEVNSVINTLTTKMENAYTMAFDRGLNSKEDLDSGGSLPPRDHFDHELHRQKNLLFLNLQ